MFTLVMGGRAIPTPKALGDHLQEVRKLRQSSLRAIAERAEISSAYLQKLERGEVQSPSPHVLLRLSKVLDVSYASLMQLTGYVVPTQQENTENQNAGNDVSVLAQALSSEDLSADETRKIAEYLSFIRGNKTRINKNHALTQLDSWRDIESATDELLRNADAYGRFPTPVSDIVAAAKLKVSDNELFSDNWLKQSPSHIRKAMALIKSKVVAILDRREKIIYINSESNNNGAKNFKKLHEVSHEILPWQSELAYADDDLTLSWNTHKKFEIEANRGAAELLFQRDIFSKISGDYEIGFASIIELSDKFGSSIHAAFRRFVETHSSVLAGVVLKPFGAAEEAESARRNESISSLAWLEQFSDPRDWPKTLQIEDFEFLSHAVAAKLNKGQSVYGDLDWQDKNGDFQVLNVEAFFNGYNIFVLLWRGRRRGLKRRVGRVRVSQPNFID